MGTFNNEDGAMMTWEWSLLFALGVTQIMALLIIIVKSMHSHVIVVNKITFVPYYWSLV